MSLVERQVHGYRQGHRLLAASSPLPKKDQAVIDRLSDVAGPLRPREVFEPYLTAYPLPSGERYVLARTWQDLTVARAGCVRTLSLIVPIDDWARAEGLSSYLNLVAIDKRPDESEVAPVVIRKTLSEPLPPASEFSGSELLEALFLEEPRPVVALDAVDPELMAIRLLTALWPSLRRRFAISTFALSPRKISGRDFDLLFAPKDARAKFADWNGRRVDGRLLQPGRHRWTRTIASRVLDRPYPRLLSAAELDLVGGDDPGIDNAAVLRIVLLWNELAAKLTTTPTAALGLLDIANSGKVRDSHALAALEPLLANAAHEASANFPEAEAWDFLGAMARKLLGRSMPNGRAAVGEAVEQLAARAPEGAIAFLSQEDPRGVTADLLPRIATGIGSMFTARSEAALLSAEPTVIGRLLAQGGPLVAQIANDRRLIGYLGQVLTQIDADIGDRAGPGLLAVLTEDWQIPALIPLLDRLDAKQLLAELIHVGKTSDFAATLLSSLVAERALSTSSAKDVRQALVSLPATERRDAIIARTLAPCLEDAAWLANTDALDRRTAMTMLTELLRIANESQFIAMLADPRAVDAIELDAPELLHKALSYHLLPLDVFVRVLPTALASLSVDAGRPLAKHGLSRLLPLRFSGDEVELLASLLGMAGDELDGAWAARIGLGRNVDAAIASRNMVAFHKASQPARLRLVWSIDEMAEVLRQRQSFDINNAAADACAAFLFDAETVAPQALLRAAGHLLPLLLTSKDRPVSPLIAAVFPPIYREYAEADEVSDFFRIFMFFDWDRCKTARNELVDVFMSSSWPPHDLALTACRTNEVFSILERVSKQSGGEIVYKADSSRY